MDVDDEDGVYSDGEVSYNGIKDVVHVTEVASVSLYTG